MVSADQPGCGWRREDLLAIEQASARLWLAHEQQPMGGWLWRYSHGGSQRANSVATLADPAMDVGRAIAAAELLYRKHGAPAWFQITEVSVPSGLDAELAKRGYVVRDRCETLACVLSVPNLSSPSASGEIEMSSALTPAWFATYASTITPDRRAQAQAILERVPAPRAFCGLRRDGELIATTLCAVDGSVARIKCVATRDAARRTGAAEAVVRAALGWAARGGARIASLGLTATNTPAQTLYAKLGFTLAGRYHIRAKDI